MTIGQLEKKKTIHRSKREEKKNKEYRKKMITPWTKENQTNRGQQKNRKKNVKK